MQYYHCPMCGVNVIYYKEGEKPAWPKPCAPCMLEDAERHSFSISDSLQDKVKKGKKK